MPNRAAARYRRRHATDDRATDDAGPRVARGRRGDRGHGRGLRGRGARRARLPAAVEHRHAGRRAPRRSRPMTGDGEPSRAELFWLYAWLTSMAGGVVWSIGAGLGWW